MILLTSSTMNETCLWESLLQYSSLEPMAHEPHVALFKTASGCLSQKKNLSRLTQNIAEQ